MPAVSAGRAATPDLDDEPKLNFHGHFKKKHPGDVILQGDDARKQCFYFNLSLLSALSSFFRDLPPPSCTDMANGVALIPLPNTSSGAILIALSAVQATTRAELFTISLPTYDGQPPRNYLIPHIIDAALFASRFDLPAIYRILLEGIHRSVPVRRTPFLEFTIWAISGVQSKIVEAAEASVESDITQIEKPISLALRCQAPDCWMRLQDLHLRRALGHKRFHAQAVRGVRGGCERCLRRGRGQRQTDEVNKACLLTQSIREIYELEEQSFGLSCEHCAAKFKEDYGAKMAWIRDYTSRYILETDYDYYVKGGW